MSATDRYPHRDPVPWPGVGPEVDAALRSAIVAGETVTAGPIEFLVPPSSSYFPNFTKVTQQYRLLLLTDRAFYSLAVRLDPAMVVASNRIALADIAMIQRHIAKRMARAKRAPVVDWMYVLIIRTAGGDSYAAESRFQGAAQFAGAVETAVAEARG